MAAQDRTNHIHISPLGWSVIALAFLGPWAVVGWLLGSRPKPAPAIPATPASAPAPVAAAGLKAGAWGELEIHRILIEPPEEFIPPDFGVPSPLRWVLRDYTPAMVEGLWQRANLNASELAALRAATDFTPSGAVITPPEALVLELTRSARATLYTALAEFPENRTHFDPFRFRADAVREWFEHSEVAPEIVALTTRLLYARHNALLFSDQDIVLPRIASTEARIHYLKTLARRSALLVRLFVPPGAKIDHLAAYWTHGQRGKDVRPLLRSLSRQPGGGFIDIAHLLPPVARSLLNTYPVRGRHGPDHDCHWTSFNFLRDDPDEQFFSIDAVRETLLRDYHPVTGEPAFGDLILLVQPDGVVVHSCAHVADDIVFTKNGSAFYVPWMLSRLDNVVAAYSAAAPVEVRRYRARHPAP